MRSNYAIATNHERLAARSEPLLASAIYREGTSLARDPFGSGRPSTGLRKRSKAIIIIYDSTKMLEVQ